MRSCFESAAPVVGMVHLPPLPGAPGFDGDRSSIRERALIDARRLVDGGVDGVVVENFGDAPFYPDDVPKHTVAAMTRLVQEVSECVSVPVGVNVLRNDTEAALSVAAATDAAFVRVNVHTGARVTDQGVVEGRAHETIRLRERLDVDVALLADVDVKHSSPLGSERPVAEEVADAVERGRADAVVASGPATGRPIGTDRLSAVADACAHHDVPLFVGSGVTTETVGDLLTIADGVIVGTAFKRDGVTSNPVDDDQVRALVEAATA